MEGATRSGKKYTKIFTTDSGSESDSKGDPESDSELAKSLYSYTMSTTSASSPTPGSSDFEKKVEEQVQKTIRAMIASGALVNLASPTTVTTYVTDPFKGDFNPADKHGAFLFKTATEPFPEKDIFFLNQDNERKCFIF